MITLSKSTAALLTMSRCPLVTGSKLPGYIAVVHVPPQHIDTQKHSYRRVGHFLLFENSPVCLRGKCASSVRLLWMNPFPQAEMRIASQQLTQWSGRCREGQAEVCHILYPVQISP